MSPLLPIGDSALLSLNKYLEDTRSALMTARDEYAAFVSDYGEVGIGRLVKHTMKKAGIKKEGFAHLFIHVMATHMLESGANIRFIQAGLGHSDLKSTRVYTRVSIEKLRGIHQAKYPTKS